MNTNGGVPPFKGVDYYGLLNISKDASTEEIRASYKKLALTYHPDRHIDVSNKSEAQQKFSVITAAYETLSDPSKRSLYDLHGVEGLQYGRELVTRIRDPGEAYLFFECSHILGSDFRKMFVTRTTLPEIANFKLTQSVNAPFTKKDTASISAGVTIEKNKSSVSLGVGWHHALSTDTSAFTEFSSDNTNIAKIGIAHRLGKKTHGAITASASGWGQFHNVTMTLERALGQHATASVAVTYGALAGVKVLLRRAQDNNPLALELDVGFFKREVSISKTKHLSKKSLVRIATKLSNEGFGVEANILRRISPEITKLSVLAAIICPFIVVSFTKMLLINPSEAKKDKRKREERKRQNAAAISEARRVAEGDIRLMTSTVMRKRAMEENRGGLVIIEARYGRLEEAMVDPDYPPMIDVAIPLQYLVEDSQLILHDGPKTGLLGFYDPRIDESKALLIRYLFKRKLHQVIINDNEPLQAPLRSHLL